MPKNLVFLFITIAFVSCSPVDNFPLHLLEGKWESVNEKNAHYEEWTNNDYGLSGIGYVMTAGDTVFIEHLSIEKVEGLLTYLARVPGHNGGETIPFQIGKETQNSIVFENKSHDFPQRIIYELAGDDQLNARIEGYDDGEFKEVKFNYRKFEN